MTRRAGGGRDHALDGLRGLAALGVLVLHVWMFDHGDSRVRAKSPLDHALGELRLGVVLFFVLSGYLLYRPVVAARLQGRPGPSWGVYAVRRACRIVPAYWFALAGAVVVTSLAHRDAVAPGQLYVFLAFAQNYTEATANHLDPPMWTLGVEVSFYALLPIAALATQRLAARRGAQLVVPGGLILVGVALAGANALHPWPRTIGTSLLLHVGEFACGMVAAVLMHDQRMSVARRRLLRLVGGALVVLDAVWHSYVLGDPIARSTAAELPAAIGFALLIAGLVVPAGDIGRRGLLTSRPLQRLGDLSYALYLWHFIVIIALRSSGHWPSNLGQAIGLTALLTTIPAAFSWFLLERPASRWAARATRGSASPRVPTARRARRPAPGPSAR